MAGLIEGSDHFLYGTTYQGGGTGFNGTIFKINKDGTSYQILYAFPSTAIGLQRPNSELLEGQDGALYGTTDYSSAPYSGGIYKIDKNGNGYTALRIFGSGADGETPKCALLQLTDGVFYGTTEYGGTQASGCVFTLSSSLLPPRLLSLSVFGSSNVLQFTATSDVTYDVERSADLSSWSVLATIVPPTNYTDLNPPPSGGAFYRLHQH